MRVGSPLSPKVESQVTSISVSLQQIQDSGLTHLDIREEVAVYEFCNTDLSNGRVCECNAYALCL